MADVRIVARANCDRLGEGPLWSSRDRVLYWCDILGRQLHRLNPASGAIHSWTMPDVIGWVIERADGVGLMAGIGRSVARLTLEPLTIEVLAELPEPADNRVNDAKAAPDGSIWLGTMPFDCSAPTGSLHRFAAGRVERVASGYTIANGPAIDAAGRWLLHTDTAKRTVFRYPLENGRAAGAREPFIVFEDGWGNPDGMTLDAEGGLWIACWSAGRVTRFTPEGRIDRSIALPASQITSCTFAGQALDRMFVTSAAVGVDEPAGGALFEVDPGCRGLPGLTYRD